MHEDRNKQVIREFTRIFKNEHNVDGVAQLFDTKGFIHHFRAPLPAGFEGFRQVGIMMNRAFPDVVVTEEDLITSGDRVVERSAAVATHKGSMVRNSCLSAKERKDLRALGGDCKWWVQDERATFKPMAAGAK